MEHIVAIYRAGKVSEILRRQPGVDLKTATPYERAVIITGRPDVKVGDPWPMCTMEEALATGKLQRAPTEKDPSAVRVPTVSPVTKGDK